MDVIIKTVCKWLLPFILLFGIYIIFHGHLTPGGSFPGGTVIAAGMAMTAVAFGLKSAERRLNEKTTGALEVLLAVSLALLIFVELPMRSMLEQTGNLFEIWSAQTVLFPNVVGGVMVAMSLVLITYLMISE
jgi:multicomponent Na+:H+ antiporter subunit B